MKRTILLTILALSLTAVFAQTPQAFKYQAVARNAAGQLISNQSVNVQISVLQGSVGGTSVYSETHTAVTNDFGLVNLEIGNGTLVGGSFATIDWAGNSHFVQVEMDETGGTTYQLIGTFQLLSVPYAMQAVKSKEVADADGNTKIQVEEAVNENRIRFDINGSQAMIIDQNNRVGIGVPAPTTPLDVSGTVHATNFTGNGQTLSFSDDANMQPYTVVNYIICIDGVFAFGSGTTDDAFLGEIKMFAGTYAPDDWLFCNGQILPIITNQDLFSILGTTYGGDGETTFGLPDLRGRVAIHDGGSTGPGLSQRQLGQKSGVEDIGQ